MKILKQDFKKTLLYNLIIFDFILLESSTNKISNFFLEKVKTSTQKGLKTSFRFSLEDTVKSFKRFIRMLTFLKSKKKKNLFTFINNSEYTLELIFLVFKQFKLNCFFEYSSSCAILDSKRYLKSVLLFDFPLTKSNFLFFFFKKIFFLHMFNDYGNNVHYNTYKIFSSLEDYKKIIFLSLILVSIFKK